MGPILNRKSPPTVSLHKRTPLSLRSEFVLRVRDPCVSCSCPLSVICYLSLCYLHFTLWHLSFDIWHFPSRLHPQTSSLRLSFPFPTATPHDRSTARLLEFALRALFPNFQRSQNNSYTQNVIIEIPISSLSGLEFPENASFKVFCPDYPSLTEKNCGPF